MNKVKAEEEECRGGTGNGCWKLHQEKSELKIEEGGMLEPKVVDQKVEEQEAEQEDHQQQNELAQQHSAILAKSLASVAQTYYPHSSTLPTSSFTTRELEFDISFDDF